MKSILLVTILIFAFCGLRSFASAQIGNGNKPKQWTYASVDEDDEDSLQIVITQGKNGYEVSGKYHAANGLAHEVNCRIHGTYFPATGRFKGRCAVNDVLFGKEVHAFEVEGSKLNGENGFKVNVAGKDFVVKPSDAKQKPEREGKLKTSENSSENDLLRQIAGRWQREEGAIIEIRNDGTGVFQDIKGDAANYGFKTGDISFNNIRAVGKDSLGATLITRAEKGDCPSLETLPVKASIKIDSGRRTMSLTAPRMEYDLTNCSWTNERVGTINHTYTRID